MVDKMQPVKPVMRNKQVLGLFMKTGIATR